MFNHLLNFLLPATCPLCHERVDHHPALCASCWKKLHFISNPKCQKCGYPFLLSQEQSFLCFSCTQSLPLYSQGRSVFYYDEASKPLILRFKYADATSLTSLFVQWLSLAGEELIQKSDIIVPIPLHWRRLLKRRYNQTAILAQALSKKYKKIYLPNLLYCTRYFQPQGHKTKEQRQKNVQGKFSVSSSKIKILHNKTILLIDDVYASGATLQECVKVLRRHCHSSINVLTLARVVQ